MRTIFSILTLSFFCLIFQNRTFAQDENTGYAKVEYMKVKSGMWDKYVACEKAWKLVHEYRVRQGLITGWEFEQVLIPAGTNNEYDFLTVTLYKDWKSLYTETDWYTAAMKSLPADKREIAEKAEDYRDIVKTEIWSAGDLAGNPGAKFRVENFMRIPEGGWQKWIEMESKFVKPVHEKNIAAGNRAGWLLAFMDLPRGSDLPYQASTVDYFDKWEDMAKDEGKAWKEVYPDLSWGDINRKIEGTRVIARTEVRMLLDSVR
ncbi:MAG: hypothetical protein H6576_07610 [Lewinellaceae bacterium]|nr:hypothetical protein [Saprospiraceae bacterium]MCB9343546.1 hypothetical protein [Lewinellaceae bacterium]